MIWKIKDSNCNLEGLNYLEDLKCDQDEKDKSLGFAIASHAKFITCQWLHVLTKFNRITYNEKEIFFPNPDAWHVAVLIDHDHIRSNQLPSGQEHHLNRPAFCDGQVHIYSLTILSSKPVPRWSSRTHGSHILLFLFFNSNFIYLFFLACRAIVLRSVWLQW